MKKCYFKLISLILVLVMSLTLSFSAVASASSPISLTSGTGDKTVVARIVDYTSVIKITYTLPDLSTFSDAAALKQIFELAKVYEGKQKLVIVDLTFEGASGLPETFILNGEQLGLFVGSGNVMLQVGGPAGAIRFDKLALDSIVSQLNGKDLSVLISQVPTSTVGSQYPDFAGKPVYNISVAAGNTNLTTFGNGTIAEVFPYKLADGEDANNVVLFELVSGKQLMMQHCVYDEATKSACFTTDHISVYGAKTVAPISYSDISGWYAGFVTYLSDRGIMSGTGTGIFSPNLSLSRGQLVKILANLSGTDLSKYSTSHFSDVLTTDWFFRCC